MTTQQSEAQLVQASRELAELIATETVRTRHIALVRLQGRVQHALDNLINPAPDEQ